MTSATQKSTKRIACVGEDDEAFVAALLCELEQLGLNARHMSAFSLRLAPRPPDLTVLLGDATENGGGEIADQLGTARGPIAVVMPPGALAARLEARQRGFFVVPRSEEPAKLARALVALLDSDEEKAATLEDAPPSPPPSDEATDTVFEAVTVRPEPSRPKPPPIPKPRAIPRKTLLGIAASPPIPAPAKLQAADPHQAITHPQAAAPEQLEHETKELRIPEARDGSAPIGTRKNAFTAQERMDTTGGEPPKRVDPDVTAPQAPLFEEMGELASPEAALVDAGETPTATAAPLSKTAHRAETTHEPSLAATPSMPAPAAPVEPSTTVQPIARTMVLDPDSLPIRAAPTPAADARPPSLPSASPDALLHAPSAGPQAPAPKRGRLILTLAVGVWSEGSPSVEGRRPFFICAHPAAHPPSRRAPLRPRSHRRRARRRSLPRTPPLRKRFEQRRPKPELSPSPRQPKSARHPKNVRQKLMSRRKARKALSPPLQWPPPRPQPRRKPHRFPTRSSRPSRRARSRTSSSAKGASTSGPEGSKRPSPRSPGRPRSTRTTRTRTQVWPEPRWRPADHRKPSGTPNVLYACAAAAPSITSSWATPAERRVTRKAHVAPTKKPSSAIRKTATHEVAWVDDRLEPIERPCGAPLCTKGTEGSPLVHGGPRPCARPQAQRILGKRKAKSGSAKPFA